MKEVTTYDIVTLQRCITDSVLPPSLKAQLIERFEFLEPEEIKVIAALLEDANRSEKNFKRVASRFEQVIFQIDKRARKRVVQESRDILAEFEEELGQLERLPE